MATKKRRIAAVTEALERKRQLTATFAERQSAAIPSARKQLEPLRVKDTGRSALKPPSARPVLAQSPFTKSLNDAFLQTMSQSMWSLAASPRWLTMPSFTLDGYESAPSITAERLDALKIAEPYKPIVAPQVPDMVECLTGWRGWALSKSGKLEALGQSTEWPSKQELRATCEASGRHVAPNWDCTCGIWAFKDVDRLVAAIGGRYATVRVIGSVSLWGKVIETENGYRAERAYPKELWLLDSSLEYLSAIYDVPIRSVQL